jgi:hypothetical protein
LRRSKVMTVFLISICGAFVCGSLQAETIYKYRDQDGRVVFTDSPPPGVSVRPYQKIRNSTAPEKKPLEKDKGLSPESDQKRNEREAKIQAARQEYEQAQKDLENYNLKKNQSGDPYTWWQWNNRIEEQNKAIEERRKNLETMERTP